MPKELPMRILLGIIFIAGIVFSYSYFMYFSRSSNPSFQPIIPLVNQTKLNPIPRAATLSNTSDPSGDEWPMFRGQLNHTGVTQTNPLTNTTFYWNFTMGYTSESSPVVSNGSVFITDSSNTLYRVNASTGNVLWSVSVPCAGTFASPAVANGSVVVGGSDNKVYCFNASTGTPIWTSIATGGGIYSSPAIYNGSVYIGSLDGRLYCFNAFNGAQVWASNVYGSIYSSPAIYNNSVYFGSTDNNVYCLNASSGMLIWNYPTTSGIYSSPAIANESVFIGSTDSYFYCLNASTGVKLWRVNGFATIYSSPTVNNGSVYVGNSNGQIFCWNASTGNQLWNYSPGGQITSSPAIADGCLFVGMGSANFKIYCLNATSGTLLWSYLTGNVIFYSSPAIANGSVFIASFDQGLYCLPMRLVPTAPQNLHATWGNGQVNLSWQAPTSNSRAPVSKYVIYRGTTPGSETYLATIGNLLQYTDTSITLGQNYYYKVNATCGVWEGLSSNEANTPVLTVTAPNVNQLFGNSTPSFTTTVIESQLSQAWYRVGLSGNNHTFTPGISTVVDSVDWETQENGTVVLYFWANDTQGDLGFTNITIRRDIIGPIITILTPGSGQVCNETAPPFSLSIAEANLDKIWYNLQGSGVNTTCGSVGDFSAQWGGCPNGTVVVTFWANDTLGNVGSVTINISKDVSPPIVAITFPGNGQLFNSTPPQFSLTITEGNLDQIWYNLQGSGSNTTCLSVGDFSTQWGGRPNGTIVVTFWANDTAGNVGSASVTIYKDINPPTIFILDPIPGQLFNATVPQFFLNIADANLDKIWYNLQGSGSNTTCLSVGDFSAQWGGRPNGTILVTFWANDTVGNVGSASITIYKDIDPPAITITSPSGNLLAGPAPPLFELSIIEGNLFQIWYSLDDNVTNTTCILSGDFTAQWGGRPNGTVVVTFWANDTMGNIGTASVIIRKNIINPMIIILTPAPNFLCGLTAPTFSLSITPNGGTTLGIVWYSLDNGVTNTSCSLTGDFSAQWHGSGNGTVQVTFWANDSVGNTGMVTLIVQKDVQPPQITIISPTDNFIANSTPPTLIYTVVEANMDKIWYTIGADPVQYFLTTNTVQIDATAWAALPAGKIALTVHANDTLGNEASKTVIVNKQDQGTEGLMLTIIIILVALTIALITIPSVRKKQKATKGRFVSKQLLNPQTTTTSGQLETFSPKAAVHGQGTASDIPPAPIVAPIPLIDTGEEVSEQATSDESGVFTYRGGRIVGPRFIFKVKVKNTTDTTITDIGIHLASYPRDCMRLITEEIRHVSKIEPKGFRSLEFELQPQKDCVEGALISSVNYLDSHNELHTIHVKPFVLKSVCDLMEPLIITEAAFDELVKQWTTSQEIITFKGEEVAQLVEDVKGILESKNFNPVSHHVQETEGKLNSYTRGIATGKYTKRRLAVIINVNANAKTGDGSITCKGFAEDESMLVACLSELLAEFRKPLVRQVRKALKEHKGISRLEDLRAELQVELPTLADAIRQDNDFLFLRGGEQVATVNYVVDLLNTMRKDYDTIPVADIEAELRPAGKTMLAILQELIATGKLRATWVGTTEIHFKAEVHKVALRAIYYIVAFISGLATIILFLLNFLK